MLSPCQVEQLRNIVEQYPVFAGDLICRRTTKELVALALVRYRRGKGVGRTSDGERLGGYVPTEAGIALLAEEGKE